MMCTSLLVALATFSAAVDDTPLVAFTPHPNGFITAWLIGGPFPNDPSGRVPDGKEGLDRRPGFLADHLGGEAEVRPVEGDVVNGTVGEGNDRWTLHLNRGEVIELDELLKPNVNAIAYAYAAVISPRAMDAKLKLGSNDAVRVWLNGRLVHSKFAARSVQIDHDVVGVRLEAGVNPILVKIEQTQGNWGCVLRLTDRYGMPIRGLHSAVRARRDRDGLADLLRPGLQLEVVPEPITREKTAKLVLTTPASWPAALGSLRLGFGVCGSDGRFASLLIRNLAPNQRSAEAEWDVSELPLGIWTAQVKVQDESGRPIAELSRPCRKIETRRVGVVLRDRDSSAPAPARVSFLDVGGDYWPPEGHRRDVPVTFRVGVGGDVVIDGRAFAYTDADFTVYLPIGPIDVRVQRGPEYVPFRASWSSTRDGETRIIQLERWIDMKARGWYSGDTHIHFVKPAVALAEARGEDLNVANVLLTRLGRLVTSREDFTGKPLRDGTLPYVVYVSEECRHNFLGHLNLLNLRSVIEPITFGGPPEHEPVGDDYPPLADAADRTRAQNGYVTWAHFAWPGGEIAADVALGKIDSADIMTWGDPRTDRQFTSLDTYYRLLNCGFKLTATGGMDKMYNTQLAGGIRVYARVEGAFTYATWIDALRRGETFVTTGPMLFFRAVAGERKYPPSGTIRLDKPGTVRIEAEVESYEPVDELEIVSKGKVIRASESTGGGKRAICAFDLPVKESTWLAARCFSTKKLSVQIGGVPVMAHTSPIYVEVAGKPVNDPAAARSFLAEIGAAREWLDTRARFSNDAQKQVYVDLFDRAGRIYEKKAVGP